MSLNWLDIVLIIIVLVAVVLGFIKGLVRQIIGLVAVIGGLILAGLYYRDFAVVMRKVIANEKAADFAVFLLIFIGVVLLGTFISFLISKMMKGPLKFLNHFLGGIFGFLKGALICGVVVFAMLVFGVGRNALLSSRLSSHSLAFAKICVYLIPAELKAQFRAAYQEVVEGVEEHGQEI